ncbi:MAG: hypothetical protein J2P25_09370 [Nocardiopsaceae bacterium]|nr:hypothetical protein [Nocardiopsaceae bacterium]
MLDRLALPDLPVLRGERVTLRAARESGIDDRLECVRREAELYPDGWRDFLQMGILQAEHLMRR